MSTKYALRMAQQKKPPPTTTAKTVPKGQSSRMTKGRNAQAKAAANKAAVEKLNAETNAGKRLTRALEEMRAVKQWEAGGRKGKRPPTPNHSAITAEYNAKERGEMPAKNTTKKTATRATTGDPKVDQKAYELRVNKGMSFADIAEQLSLGKARQARMACMRYARTNGKPDPIVRRSEAAAERYARMAGTKAAKVAAPAKKAPAKKAAKKANGNGNGGKKNGGNGNGKPLARSNVTPLPKKGTTAKAKARKATRKVTRKSA